MPDIKKITKKDGVNKRFVDSQDGTFSEIVNMIPAKAFRDVVGRFKVSQANNIYDADFEYGLQALRWEVVTAGGGTVTHLPGEGGVRMSIGTAANSLTIRQSRPYHRYQPGKSMFMATAVNFGNNNSNQVQRVGYFDDNNGIFFEQSANPLDVANPSGMYVVIRSDSASGLTQGRPTDVKIPGYMWSDPRGVLSSIDWTRIQMLWLEYAWYGAGALRWGILIDGEPIILHEIGTGNNNPSATQASLAPLGGVSTASSTTTLTVASATWIPDQWATRTLQITPSTTIASGSNGQTLPQGTINVVSTTNFPASGTVIIGGQAIYYTGVTATSFTGCTGGNIPLTTGLAVTSTTTQLARITSNTTNTLTFSDLTTGGALSVAPLVGHNWAILTIPTPGRPWARTGNLPVRYEQRNIGTAIANDMVHYGVSVLVEGGQDPQRGFTYSYGMDRNTPRRAVPSNSIRYPVLTIRPRVMGTQEYTQATAACTGGTTSTLVASSATWTTNQWAGRCVNYFTSGNTVSNVARIISNTATTLNIVDNITGTAVTNAPAAGGNYTIGLIDRGQLLPKQLIVSCDAVAIVELIAGAGVQQYDLSDLFALYSNIRGNTPDTLTVAISTASTVTANVGCHIVCQEAMS
ncbi:hypothetical protein EB118_21630 [bacterium]|nr:hypothetical protein [bacterium]